MVGKKVEIGLDITTREAQRNVAALNKELEQTDEAIDDVESAGSKMARAISKAAADMVDEIDDTARAVAALEQHLDGLDVNPADAVAGLKSMGLTADEITADAEQLGRALRDATDVNAHAAAAGFDDLDQALGRTTDSARASSTAIGGIGNSISELPGIGSLGPVAESFGQLAEGALEGEINVKQLGGAIGVLGGTAAVMLVIGKAMDSIAASKAFDTAQVEAYRDALEETGSAYEAMLTLITEAGAIEGRTGGIFGVFEGTQDITNELIEAKVKASDFITAVTEGGPALDAVREKLEAQREAHARLREQSIGDIEAYDEQDRAVSNFDAALKVLQDTYENTGGAAEDNAKWNNYLAEATETATTATEDLTGASVDAAAKLAGHRKMLDDAVAATNALREANEKLRGDLDRREAYLNLINDFDSLQAAGVEAMEKVAAGAADADEATRDYELQQISATEALLDYLDDLGDVPPEKQSEIIALIDAGALADAKRELDLLTMRREMDVYVKAQIDPRLEDSRFGRVRTSGTPSPTPPGRSAGLTAAPMSAAASVSHTTNVVVNLPRSDDARSVTAAIDRWARINGDEG